jgi:hypothetical protein
MSRRASPLDKLSRAARLSAEAARLYEEATAELSRPSADPWRRQRRPRRAALGQRTPGPRTGVQADRRAARHLERPAAHALDMARRRRRLRHRDRKDARPRGHDDASPRLRKAPRRSDGRPSRASKRGPSPCTTGVRVRGRTGTTPTERVKHNRAKAFKSGWAERDSCQAARSPALRGTECSDAESRELACCSSGKQRWAERDSNPRPTD